MLFSNTALIRVLIVASLLIFPIVLFAQDWSKIKLLKSTREDVEQILGKPTTLANYQGRYETKTNQIIVFYSDGVCDYDAMTDFKVPAWTVQSVKVIPQKSPMFRKIVRKDTPLTVVVKDPKIIVYKDSKKNIIYRVKSSKDIEYLESIHLNPDANSSVSACLPFKDSCFQRASIDLVPLKDTYKKGERVEIAAILLSYSKTEFERVWKVSDGEIVEGQGSNLLKIDTTKVRNNILKIQLTVKAKLSDGSNCMKIKELSISLDN